MFRLLSERYRHHRTLCHLCRLVSRRLRDVRIIPQAQGEEPLHTSVILFLLFALPALGVQPEATTTRVASQSQSQLRRRPLRCWLHFGRGGGARLRCMGIFTWMAEITSELVQATSTPMHII